MCPYHGLALPFLLPSVIDGLCLPTGELCARPAFPWCQQGRPQLQQPDSLPGTDWAGGLLMSPYCHLTLNLDSSSEGKMGVLTLRTATEGGSYEWASVVPRI